MKAVEIKRNVEGVNFETMEFGSFAVVENLGKHDAYNGAIVFKGEECVHCVYSPPGCFFTVSGRLMNEDFRLIPIEIEEIRYFRS